MKALIDRFSSSVKGVLSGFDRIVFKGWILPLMSASQVMSFLGSKGVLNKDYKDWMVARTKDIVDTANMLVITPGNPLSIFRHGVFGKKNLPMNANSRNRLKVD
jgi:hypothetical protein